MNLNPSNIFTAINNATQIATTYNNIKQKFDPAPAPQRPAPAPGNATLPNPLIPQ